AGGGGGLRVLPAGAYAAPGARARGSRWRLVAPPQHLWFFTEPSIERLAARLDMRLEALDHPWKIVPAALIWFQLARMLGVKSKGAALGTRLGVPVNLFDAMRVVLRKTGAS